MDTLSSNPRGEVGAGTNSHTVHPGPGRVVVSEPVYLTKGMGPYTWAVEDRADTPALLTWQPVRVWIEDPAGLFWVAFQDPALEDTCRRMVGRLNYHASVHDWAPADAWEYLLGWGGQQASFSVPATATASSVADLLARVWPGAQAVGGTSNDQADERDPLGVGQHGASPRPWGAPPEEP